MMNSADYIGKPVDFDRMNKALFDTADYPEYSPDPVMRVIIARKYKKTWEGGERDHVYCWLYVHVKGERIIGIRRCIEDGLDMEEKTVRNFDPVKERKIERILKSIIIPENKAVPRTMKWTGDLFGACASVIESARRGRSMLLRSGPFILVSCGEGRSRDAWLFYPVKNRVMYLSANRSESPLGLTLGLDGFNVMWDGCYSVYGEGFSLKDIRLDVYTMLYPMGGAFCLPYGK